MDQIIHKILRFDRFALDLTRGCLRDDERDIDLRPKAFDVLRHLAENAGRLVSKQEFFEAVWPDVTVTDDSLVQCIRELRDKLGDHDHRLIKTVSRRGYLLDATLTAPASSYMSGMSGTIVAPAPQRTIAADRDASGRFLNSAHAQNWRVWTAVAVGIACLTFGGTYLSGLPASVLNRLDSSLLKKAPAQPRHVFKDCDVCTEMVELTPGEFLMGSPESEPGREGNEGPQRRIVLTQRVAIGKFEVTVDQFAAFVAETGFEPGDQCRAYVGLRPSQWPWVKGSFWEPGFRVTGMHPAVCVSWQDAKAYTAWLSRKTGRPYRLPTEAEWEYAARAGNTRAFSFGDEPERLCEFAQFADRNSSFPWASSCHSATFESGALRVGTLAPNPWGLFDMHGNAWEWAEDCWTSEAQLRPTDGSAYRGNGDCGIRPVRGGGWPNNRGRLRSASRVPQAADARYYHLGFRLALTPGPN